MAAGVRKISGKGLLGLPVRCGQSGLGAFGVEVERVPLDRKAALLAIFAWRRSISAS